jgi:hypothetical protein
MLFSLSTLNHVELDSEQSVIVYGMGIITLNAMMYLGLPVIGIISLRKIF